MILDIIVSLLQQIMKNLILNFQALIPRKNNFINFINIKINYKIIKYFENYITSSHFLCKYSCSNNHPFLS